MEDVKSPYPLCERDGFPMLRLDGRLQCVAEYLDRCIGQQPVVDLVQRGETVFYVFENGHELPMLCYCCGRPLAYRDLEESRRDMRGRRLEAMSVGTVTLEEDGSEILQFCLELSKKGGLSQEVCLPVAPEVPHDLSPVCARHIIVAAVRPFRVGRGPPGSALLPLHERGLLLG